MAWYDNLLDFGSGAVSTIGDTASSLFDSSSYQYLTQWQKASTALQLGAGLVGAYQQSRSASRNAEASNQAIRQNLASRQNQLDLQAMQLEDQTQQQMSTVERAARRESATTAAMAGEAGIGGALLDRLLFEGEFGADENAANLQSNLRSGLGQIRMNGVANAASANSQINQNNAAAKAAKPNWLGVGLSLGSMALGAAQQSTQNQMAAQKYNAGIMPK